MNDAIIGKYRNMKVKNIKETSWGHTYIFTLNRYLNDAEWRYFDK